MPENPEILIAEDNPRDREFLTKNLSGFTPVLTSHPLQVIELANQKENPLIISDLQMPEINGIELAKSIWAKNTNARIIFWSHYGDETYIRSLAKIIPEETVYGYILKDNPSDILNKSCQAVFKEYQCWIDPKLRPVQARTNARDSSISDLEYEVLIDIALGLTDNMIAQRRYLSRRGAQNRLKSLYNKLGVSQDDISTDSESLNLRTRAVSVAMRRGLINNYELEQEESSLQNWMNLNSKIN